MNVSDAELEQFLKSRYRGTQYQEYVDEYYRQLNEGAKDINVEKINVAGSDCIIAGGDNTTIIAGNGANVLGISTGPCLSRIPLGAGFILGLPEPVGLSRQSSLVSRFSNPFRQGASPSLPKPITGPESKLYHEILYPDYNIRPITEQAERNRQILLWAINKGVPVPEMYLKQEAFSLVSTAELMDKTFNSKQLQELHGAMVAKLPLIESQNGHDPQNMIAFGGITYTQRTLSSDRLNLLDGFLASQVERLMGMRTFREPGFLPGFLRKDIRGSMHVTPYGVADEVQGKNRETVLMLVEDMRSVLNYMETHPERMGFPRYILNGSNKKMAEIAEKYFGAQIQADPRMRIKQGVVNSFVNIFIPGNRQSFDPYIIFMSEQDLKNAKPKLDAIYDKLVKTQGEEAFNNRMKKIRIDAIEEVSKGFSARLAGNFSNSGSAQNSLELQPGKVSQAILPGPEGNQVYGQVCDLSKTDVAESLANSGANVLGISAGEVLAVSIGPGCNFAQSIGKNPVVTALPGEFAEEALERVGASIDDIVGVVNPGRDDVVSGGVGQSIRQVAENVAGQKLVLDRAETSLNEVLAAAGRGESVNPSDPGYSELIQVWRTSVRVPSEEVAAKYPGLIDEVNSKVQTAPDFKNPSEVEYLQRVIKVKKQVLEKIEDGSLYNMTPGQYEQFFVGLRNELGYKGSANAGFRDKDIFGSYGAVLPHVIDIARKYDDPVADFFEHPENFVAKTYVQDFAATEVKLDPKVLSNGVPTYKVKLENIPENGQPGFGLIALPTKDGTAAKTAANGAPVTTYVYPKPIFITSYAENANNNLKLLGKDAPLGNQVEHMEGFYKYCLTSQSFWEVNHSLCMTVFNTLLESRGLRGLDQSIYDFTALYLLPENSSKFIVDEVIAVNPEFKEAVLAKSETVTETKPQGGWLNNMFRPVFNWAGSIF